MRLTSILIACGALISGAVWVGIVSKFREIYQEMEITAPPFTSIFVDSSGWIPGGILFAMAGLLLALDLIQWSRAARFVAFVTCLFIVGTGVVLPQLLIEPVTGVIEEMEAENELEKKATPKPKILDGIR